MKEKCSRLMIELELGEWVKGFDLEKAVCNHGMFMMPPNQWIPSSKTLQRLLRLSDNSTSVIVSISQPNSNTTKPSSLLIQILHSSPSLSPQDQQAITDQVTRMLRLTQSDQQNLTNFQNLHPKAKQMGFGRLFRSPTLFEDAVKCILLCNTTWKRTLEMARKLCEIQPKIAQTKGFNKRKRGQKSSSFTEIGVKVGNFPNATELSKTSAALLRKHSIGYRADYIVKLARKVESGRINLHELEKDIATSDSISSAFTKIKGFGTFAIANLLMCVGFYQQIPIDTETIRHLKQVHGKDLCSKKTVQEDVKEIYDKYAPFQCLAYWLELIEYYESKFGKLSQLCSLDYDKISGTMIKLN